jgi:hypothetical protein
MTSKTPDNTSRDKISPVRGALKLKASCDYCGGISQVTMHRLIARGLIKPNRALRHIIIPIAELDRFLCEGMSK